MNIVNQNIGTVGNVQVTLSAGVVKLNAAAGEDLGALCDILVKEHSDSKLLVAAAGFAKAALAKTPDVNILSQHLGTVGEIDIGIHGGKIGLTVVGDGNLADLISKLEADHSDNKLIGFICEAGKGALAKLT